MRDPLNFFASDFDPLLALTTPGVTPPIINARPLDNLHAWRRLLPPEHPLHLAPRSDAGKIPVSEQWGLAGSSL